MPSLASAAYLTNSSKVPSEPFPHLLLIQTKARQPKRPTSEKLQGRIRAIPRLVRIVATTAATAAPV